MNKRLSKSLSEKWDEKGFNGYLCRSLKYRNKIHDVEVASASNTTPGSISARAINLGKLFSREVKCSVRLFHNIHLISLPQRLSWVPQSEQFTWKLLWISSNRIPYFGTINVKFHKVRFRISHKAAFPWLDITLCWLFSNGLFSLNRCWAAAGRVWFGWNYFLIRLHARLAP